MKHKQQTEEPSVKHEQQAEGPSVKHEEQTEEPSAKPEQQAEGPSVKHEEQTEEPSANQEIQKKKEPEHDDTHQWQLPAPLFAPPALCKDDAELTLSETEAIWQAILRLHDVSRVRFRRLGDEAGGAPPQQPLPACTEHEPGSVCCGGEAE